jgi:hypothetical protein
MRGVYELVGPVKLRDFLQQLVILGLGELHLADVFKPDAMSFRVIANFRLYSVRTEQCSSYERARQSTNGTK